MKLSQASGILIDVFGEELQGDRLSEPQIVGAIDFAHPATSQTPDDAIAAVEKGAKGEAAVIDVVRAREPAVAGARCPALV